MYDEPHIIGRTYDLGTLSSLYVSKVNALYAPHIELVPDLFLRRDAFIVARLVFYGVTHSVHLRFYA